MQKSIYKYITIVEIAETKLTTIFSVFNNRSGQSIGLIKWYAGWRQYCFFPKADTVFSKGCLQDISSFIQCEMDKRMGVALTIKVGSKEGQSQ